MDNISLMYINIFNYISDHMKSSPMFRFILFYYMRNFSVFIISFYKQELFGYYPSKDSDLFLMCFPSTFP